MTASSGASQTGLGTSNDVFSFAGLRNAGAAGGAAGASADQQVLSFSATDADGKAAVHVSHTQCEQCRRCKRRRYHHQRRPAKERQRFLEEHRCREGNQCGGTSPEGIRFISSANNFSVNVGLATNDTDSARVGIYDGTTGVPVTQGMTVNSSASGAIDISSSAGAKQAVSALGQAVKTLGSAQAAIGKGQNQLGYAINLANSQITNLSAAEAHIRDANVA